MEETNFYKPTHSLLKNIKRSLKTVKASTYRRVALGIFIIILIGGIIWINMHAPVVTAPASYKPTALGHGSGILQQTHNPQPNAKQATGE